jgi:DNA-binding GntR family transcriptional regulator
LSDALLSFPDPPATAFIGVPNYQRVRDAMRTDIARGVLAPDQRLKIAELSARYGLSPAPIREALGQLAAEGWVVMHPNRGAQVRTIDEAFLRELNEIRIALESYTVGLAAAGATPAQIAALVAIEDRYEACLSGVEPGGTARLIELNAALHDAIHDIRPNREALALMRRHGLFFNTMRRAWGYGDYRPQQIATEHRRLLDAFHRNDGALAERISREHITNAMEDLLRLWREAGRR